MNFIYRTVSYTFNQIKEIAKNINFLSIQFIRKRTSLNKRIMLHSVQSSNRIKLNGIKLSYIYKKMYLNSIILNCHNFTLGSFLISCKLSVT